MLASPQTLTLPRAVGPSPAGPGPSTVLQRGAGSCREGEAGRRKARCQALGPASPSPSAWAAAASLPQGPFSGRGARGLGSAAAPGTRGSTGAGGPGWAFGLLTCPWLGADFMKCSIKLFFLMWCPETRGGEARPWRATQHSGHAQMMLSSRWKYKYLIQAEPGAQGPPGAAT